MFWQILCFIALSWECPSIMKFQTFFVPKQFAQPCFHTFQRPFEILNFTLSIQNRIHHELMVKNESYHFSISVSSMNQILDDRLSVEFKGLVHVLYFKLFKTEFHIELWGYIHTYSGSKACLVSSLRPKIGWISTENFSLNRSRVNRSSGKIPSSN